MHFDTVRHQTCLQPCSLAACCRRSIGYKQWGWIFFFQNYYYFWRKLKFLNWGLSDGRWHLKVSDLDNVEESSDFTWLNQSIGGFCCIWNRHKLLMSFSGLTNARVWSRKLFEDVGKITCLKWALAIIFIMSCCSRHVDVQAVNFWNSLNVCTITKL